MSASCVVSWAGCGDGSRWRDFDFDGDFVLDLDFGCFAGRAFEVSAMLGVLEENSVVCA